MFFFTEHNIDKMEDIDYKDILEKLKLKATVWIFRPYSAESIECKFYFKGENVTIMVCIIYGETKDKDKTCFNVVYFNNVINTDKDGEFISMFQIIPSMLGKLNDEETEKKLLANNKFVAVKKFMEDIDLLYTKPDIKFAGGKV